MKLSTVVLAQNHYLVTTGQQIKDLFSPKKNIVTGRKTKGLKD